MLFRSKEKDKSKKQSTSKKPSRPEEILASFQEIIDSEVESEMAMIRAESSSEEEDEPGEKEIGRASCRERV